MGIQSVALGACAWAVSGSTHGSPDAKRGPKYNRIAPRFMPDAAHGVPEARNPSQRYKD